MERFDSEIEKFVFDKFETSLRDFDLTLKIEDKWETALLRRSFDLVIYKGSTPLVVVEVKSNLMNKNLLARGTDQVRSALSITNARLGVVTDGKQFYLYDRSKKDDDFRPQKFEIVIERILNPDKVRIRKKDREDVSQIIITAAKEHLDENVEFKHFIETKSFISKIKFDDRTSSYYFSDVGVGISSFENQFFNKMFGEFTETEVCRYTSVKTIFDMLSHLSFRMSGLVGMNDRSEVNYVESYLNGVERPLIKEEPKNIVAINQRYITSCTKISKRDDLTLWRLYSEDAKGVCLTFDVKKDKLNNHVLLQKVKYADAQGKHSELDFLKKIKDQVELVTGFKFEFRKIGYWKHFFKPFDYSIEEEVRLLIIDNSKVLKIKSDWLMTHTHSILNPYMDFKLNSKSFPIHLKEIILGPKCPEQETNLVQLQEMIRRKKQKKSKSSLDSDLKKLKVKLSSIKHYR